MCDGAYETVICRIAAALTCRRNVSGVPALPEATQRQIRRR
jgi:hypothetical protein